MQTNKEKPIYLDIEIAERKGFRVSIVIDCDEYALHSLSVYNILASFDGQSERVGLP